MINPSVLLSVTLKGAKPGTTSLAGQPEERPGKAQGRKARALLRSASRSVVPRGTPGPRDHFRGRVRPKLASWRHRDTLCLLHGLTFDDAQSAVASAVHGRNPGTSTKCTGAHGIARAAHTNKAKASFVLKCPQRSGKLFKVY